MAKMLSRKETGRHLEMLIENAIKIIILSKRKYGRMTVKLKRKFTAQ